MSSQQVENQSLPFRRDLLGRKAAAEFLTAYLVGRHRVAGSVPANESFVLNINAEWGLGKTYFLTEWASMLRQLGHPVVYFDAWANDLSSNPFVGFMAEIEKQLTAGLNVKQKVTQQAQNVFRTGAKVIRASAPTVAFALVKNFSGIDPEKLLDDAKKSSRDIVSSVKRDIEKENKDLRHAIGAFKEAFANFSKSQADNTEFKLPVFLMVDELDRCRPSYAIELLENIKHIFRIPNVYTIVATDSEQLAHSIRAIYGANFDSQKYLRRFFDHESRLDSPSFSQLATAMLDERGLNKVNIFNNDLSEFYPESADATVLSLIAKAMKVTTRDFQRTIDIIDSIRITQKTEFNLILLASLTMLYVSHSDIFNRYAQNPSGSTIHKALMESADARVTFTEMIDRESNYHSHRKVKVPVWEWIVRYLDGIWSDKPYENSDSWLGLRIAIQEIMGGNNNIENLRNYHNLISMAGHFSM